MSKNSGSIFESENGSIFEGKNYCYLMALIVFLFSFIPSLSPSILFSSKRMRKLYNKATIVSAGLLLAILFMDFMPHMANGGCGHSHTHSHSHSHSHSKQNDSGFFSKIGSAVKKAHPGLAVAGITFIGLILIDQKVIKHKHCGNEEEVTAETRAVRNIHKEDHMHHEHGADTEIKSCCTDGLKYQTSAKQALVFIFVFSVHSIFEGMAFSPGSGEGSKMLFVGLLVHKVLESITVGVSLFSSIFSLKTTVLLLLFYSSLTPIGIIMANATLSFLNSYLVKEIFMGLAFGSLSFIVLVEMLPPIFHSLTGTGKMLYLFTGYALGVVLIGYVHAC